MEIMRSNTRDFRFIFFTSYNSWFTWFHQLLKIDLREFTKFTIDF